MQLDSCIFPENIDSPGMHQFYRNYFASSFGYVVDIFVCHYAANCRSSHSLLVYLTLLLGSGIAFIASAIFCFSPLDDYTPSVHDLVNLILGTCFFACR